MQKTKEQLQKTFSHLLHKIDEDNRTWCVFVVQFTVCFTSSYENALRKGILKGLLEQSLISPKTKNYKLMEISPEVFIFFAHASQIHAMEENCAHVYENLADKGMSLTGYDLTVDFDDISEMIKVLVNSFGGAEPETKEIKSHLDFRRLKVLESRGALTDRQEQRRKRNKPRILIVDDERMTLQILENFTRKHGEVQKVDDAQTAINVYATFFPDIMLLDINLGQFSGLDILRVIRKYDKDCHILMVSSYKEAHIVREAVESGASGYLSKPFTAKKLKESLDRCLRN